MIAFETPASSRSESLTAPTPWPTILMATTGSSIFCSALRRASSVPCASALTTRLSSLTSPSLARRASSSRVMRGATSLAASEVRRSVSFVSAIWRAAFSEPTTWKMSPACGTSLIPDTTTGVAGGASVTLRPRSEEHTSELQSHLNLVCRLLLEKKKKKKSTKIQKKKQKKKKQKEK